MAQCKQLQYFLRFFLVFLAGLLCRPCIADIDKAIFLEIPAQNLTKSVIYLGKTCEISIVVPSQLLRGIQAKPISGDFTAKQALETLLAETSLTYKTINKRVIAIIPKELEKKAHHQENHTIEELVIIGKQITGSFLTRTDLQGSSPVDIITEQEFDISGSQSVADFLKFLPAVSGNSTSTAISNGGNGTATVTLRGLPANNTLVLINGKRITTEGLDGYSVDLNSIPSAAVERVEILKDGASAIYGTDAIAGVVNIITKREYDGFQFEQYLASSYKNDLETRSTHVLWGQTYESGSFLISLQNYDQNGIFSRDRSVSANADGRNQGGIDKRSTATESTRITLSDRSVVILSSGASGISPEDYRAATNEDRFNYFSQSSTISPSDRQNLFFSGSYHLTDSTTWRVDGGINKTEATITLAAVPLFTAFETVPITVSADNIYNPFDENILDARRRVIELDPRKQKNTTNAKRFSMSLDGYGKRSEWHLNGNWNKTDANEISKNLLDETRVIRALGPSRDCQGIEIDGCEPLNLFGAPGSITQTQLNYLKANRKLEGYAKLYGINGMINSSLFDLPAGPLLTAIGFDFRRESVDSKTIQLADISAVGDVSRDPTRGSRRIYEGFIETQIPIVKQKPLIHSFDIELAVRHSKHNDFGKNTSPKVGLRLRPIPELLIRSTYSDGFRAPNLGEQYAGGYQTQLPLEDPCARPASLATLPGCSQQSDDSRIQYLTTFLGEPNLEPETAKSYTVGAVWTPSYFGNLHLSIDKFNIEQKNIVSANAQLILDRNAEFNEFEGLITRDENGNIIEILSPFINVGERRVSGVDATLKYLYKSKRYGNINYSLNASYLQEYATRLEASDPLIDIAGIYQDAANEGNGALPEWKANTGLFWSHKNVEFNYSINYISDVLEQIPRTIETRYLGSWITHDMQFSFNFGKEKQTKISIGADNLWNKKPPFAASAFNDNYDARTYDIKGQFIYAKLVFTAY